MNIGQAIDELVLYAVDRGLIGERDSAYAVNMLIDTLGIKEHCASQATGKYKLSEILGVICDYAVNTGIVENDSVVYRDLFDTRIMGLLTPRPSEVIKRFYELYEKDPCEATDYFYAICKDSNYIRTDRIEKDLKWIYPSKYGDIDITVNLSKPEKDPKAIAAAKLLPQSGYPKCLLCHENEGFAGDLSKPARQNLRQIPFNMAGSEWYVQYSPYVYYNEHCIALSGEHTPMKIDRSSFEKLLGFVDCFPHYFIGSNADLPIVGGSILSHDHMQGGRYSFAMERAEIEKVVEFDGFADVSAGIVKWPMSVIRLSSSKKDRLVELADRILIAWRGYTDEKAFIYAETDGAPHNTITPIARRRGELYELDLVLRNNITTDEHPLGVYHPHAEYHHIKKENIGLIEVMGLAVLPARLKSEMEEMKSALLGRIDMRSAPTLASHADWLTELSGRYEFTEENTDEIIRAEIGRVFVGILENSGVYKDTREGKEAFARFISAVNG